MFTPLDTVLQVAQMVALKRGDLFCSNALRDVLWNETAFPFCTWQQVAREMIEFFDEFERWAQVSLFQRQSLTCDCYSRFGYGRYGIHVGKYPLYRATSCITLSAE